MGWRQAGKKRFVTTTSQGRDGRREGKALAVNVSDLEKKFEAGAEITVESLAKAGFSDNPKIKILGTGERGSRRSSRSRARVPAKAKIEKAGGRIRRLRQRGTTKS